MQKRSAAQYAEALQLRINRLRKRGLRSMRGKILPETLRESHAREFAVRSWIVPSFRSKLKENLKLIILPGSVQLGIRKASRRRKSSDIDVSIVVADGALKNAVELAAVSERGLKALTGVEVNVHVFPEDIFIFNELRNPDLSAFQVLFGKQWLVKKFGKDFDKNFGILKFMQKQKNKYAFTDDKE